MSALGALLDHLPRTSLVVGKGGVGKTTCAAALATMFARRGEHTLLVSTDPAAALSNVIGEPVTSHGTPSVSQQHLDVRQLDANELRRAFLEQWRDVIADIVDRGTYLDRDDVDGLVDAALPGADEIFALLALAEVLTDPASAYRRVVIDTAPTGHTLRLLALPETFRALIALLDAMQDKHRFMVRALTHRYRADRADAFLEQMRSRIDNLRSVLADGNALASVLVTRDEPVVISETRRYHDELSALHVHIAAVVVNAASNVERAEESAREVNASIQCVIVPRAHGPLAGLASIADWFESPAIRQLPARSKRAHDAPAVPASDIHHLVRTLTIVGGKGGVGKSTVACALAIAAADADGAATLLVSTDPAPSIADALDESDADWARADVEQPIAEVDGLVVRQMDAAAAFNRLRDEYQTRIDALFDNLTGRGIDLGADRGILRDLLALAPPGIDELFALSILGDALHDGRYARILVDPAPTGHLLRLLEMPSIALDWTHRLMRLMLKYRDVAGLGDTAAGLLDFAKGTRALDALLRDPARSGLVIVALDEAVVRAETLRLAEAARARGVDVEAIVWNRLHRTPVPLPHDVTARQFFAGEVSPPPVGASALRIWSRSWRALSSAQ